MRWEDNVLLIFDKNIYGTITLFVNKRERERERERVKPIAENSTQFQFSFLKPFAFKKLKLKK